jgi:hypothetical protein
MRFCTACGTPVSGTRSYCTHCGAAIRRTADPSQAADLARAADPHLAAAQVGAAHREQSQRASARPAGPGNTQATAPALAAAPPASLTAPASPGPAAITLPSTWLADFDQPPEPPACTEPAALRSAAPASGRTLLAVAVVAVLIAAGSAAWMAGSGRPRAGRHPTAASGVSARSSRQLAHPARSASPRPSSSTLTPIPSSRRGIVSASRPLAQRADAQQVVGFLDSYFAAVNHREYLEYSSLFDRWHHLTRAEFDRGYRTTHDSSAVLVGLTSSKNSLTATVTFTSRQSPAASPDHATCTNWRIVLYLRRTGGVYLIGPPPPGYHATYHGCR